MKLEWTEGCICYGLDVDGKPFKDFDVEEKINILNKLIDTILMDYMVQDVVIELLHQYGEYKHIGHCDECGDNISSFTLEI
jgi:hypothetical protein